jgi:hypothetical protein
MKWSNIQEGKQYRVCSDSLCGTFIAGDIVKKHGTWVEVRCRSGLTGWIEKGQWENIDCEVELVE